MEFEADPTKAAQNLKKHKISFEEAASVFGDPMAYTFADPDHSVGEKRWLTFLAYRCKKDCLLLYTRNVGAKCD